MGRCVWVTGQVRACAELDGHVTGTPRAGYAWQMGRAVPRWETRSTRCGTWMKGRRAQGTLGARQGAWGGARKWATRVVGTGGGLGTGGGGVVVGHEAGASWGGKGSRNGLLLEVSGLTEVRYLHSSPFLSLRCLPEKRRRRQAFKVKLPHWWENKATSSFTLQSLNPQNLHLHPPAPPPPPGCKARMALDATPSCCFPGACGSCPLQDLRGGPSFLHPSCLDYWISSASMFPIMTHPKQAPLPPTSHSCCKWPQA